MEEAYSVEVIRLVSCAYSQDSLVPLCTVTTPCLKHFHHFVSQLRSKYRPGPDPRSGASSTTKSWHNSLALIIRVILGEHSFFATTKLQTHPSRMSETTKCQQWS
jgi:hypothetical protein